MIIFNRLFAYMAEHDITSKELSERSVVSMLILRNLRHNKKSSTQIIEKLCKALGCHPSDIIEYTPEEI